MRQQVLDDGLARSFLLGELSPEEQWEIEERAFLDGDTLALLQAAEDDLIDEFVSDDLSPDEKERFKKYVLSKPGRRADLRIARALQKHLSQDPVPFPAFTNVIEKPNERISFREWLNIRGAVFRLSFATAVILIAVTGIWLVVRIFRQQNRHSPIQAQRQQTPELPTPEDSKSEASKEPTQLPQKDSPPKTPSSTRPSVAPVYSFVLLPGGPIRDEGDSMKVELPSASDVASLQLLLPDGTSSYRSYEATLQADDGKVIRVWHSLGARVLKSGKAVQISIPATLLKQQQHYRILLRGTSSAGKVRDISSYYFPVGP
ncbi:MAG TPA: hypothetical protein VN956_17130 [Pyrinomonadaceae bacterium]|nr:hypothetical protein [Pyrinomonadaceae bacterium]